MATVGSSVLTLQDWAKRRDPDGKIASVAEVLAETNDILKDMLWSEGNLPTGHKTTIRTGLPSVAWRLLNYGVAQSKSTTVQVTDACGMLEAYATVDKALADLNSDTAGFRFSEEIAFLEAMNQEMASTIFYGNTQTDPEKFLGLAPRYGDLSASNGENILNGGGTGSDNTSIWLVYWGPRTCFGIFPKGSRAGLNHQDKGQETITDSAGGLYEAYRSHFKWDAGLCLRDWRYVVRIANIDVSDLTADASGSSANVIDLMIRALHKIPVKTFGRPAFYVNETIETYLDLQTKSQSNVNLNYGKDEHGMDVLRFRGIPIRRSDAILDTEAQVT